MPTYTCPACHRQVHDVKVYNRMPETVKCPKCGKIFDPNKLTEAGPYGNGNA